MKRFLSILIATLLVFTSVCTVSAAETAEMKAVLQKVKERIGNTDEYKNFYSQTEEDEIFGTVYNFEWTADDDTLLSVYAVADGTVLSYFTYDNGKSEKIPISETATKSEIEAYAQGFMKQLNPDISDNFKAESVTFYTNYAQVTFAEYKNEYPIKNSFASLELSKDGKTLQNLMINYEGGKNFESGTIIEKDSAVKSFCEKIGLELYYDVTHKADGAFAEYKTTVTPLYSAKSIDKHINAISGDVFEENGSISAYYSSGGTFDEESSSAEDSSNDFSAAEITEIENTEGLISKEKAFEILKSISCLEFPKITINDVSTKLSTDTFDNSKKYIFTYRSKGDKLTSVMSATIDAENGEILSYTFREIGESKNETVEISSEKTDGIAEKAIKELAPKKHSEYKASNDLSENGYRTYIRQVNGIPVYADTAEILINPKTEKIMSWKISYTEKDFPAIENVISKSEAEKIFFENTEYAPQYIYDYANSEYKLCYVPEDLFAEIDPFSGDFISSKRAEVTGFSDISGHYAEEVIKALSESNIGFSGDTFRPDEPIKQKEFASLLRDVVKYRELQCVLDDNYDYEEVYRYNSFIENDKKNPEGNVTRLDAAKFTVSAMGLSEIAELDIFKPMFSDVTEGTGYISILSGMNILNGDGNGHFNPEGILTRAQAFIIIYNYLNR